ncbi:MAG: tRNA (adenosine(37)-N6)-threonylcarbamoyltransferase complex transferase subunit TsaD [Planctomycetota bacterium]|nr:tRNA (adenosine(37)-N6)-threonylcarbamoyltransferase complex transferase subunit TsaD [Planctomycetota bacterium]
MSERTAKTSLRTVLVGIESTCDETACAVVADGTTEQAGGREVVSSVVASQSDLHARFGGVVPEIASRAHTEAIGPVISRALAEAGAAPACVAAVAVANRPGLIGSLLVGLMAAKTLAWVWRVPLIGVNHIHAHAYSPAMDSDPIEYPAVALIASGGHTSLYLCRSPMDLELLGATIDDAAGEAFDKVSTILNLGHPGGPAIEQAARGGRADAIKFPRSLLKGQSLDFSFSGIKTAVLYHVNGVPGAVREGVEKGVEHLSEQDIADIAASFQAAMVDVMRIKIRRAVQAAGAAVRTIIVGGGVAANSALRRAVVQLGGKLGVAVRIPDMKYCTDNAAMVAGLAWHHLHAGRTDDLRLAATATVQRLSSAVGLSGGE